MSVDLLVKVMSSRSSRSKDLLSVNMMSIRLKNL